MGAVSSKSDALKLSIASVYTTIARCLNIDGPALKPKVFDATTLDGGVGEARKPTGYAEAGPCTARLLFDPSGTTDQALTDLYTTPALADWKRVFPDTKEWVWSGTLTGFTPHSAVNQPLTADIEITPDGLVTVPT